MLGINKIKWRATSLLQNVWSSAFYAAFFVIITILIVIFVSGFDFEIEDKFHRNYSTPFFFISYLLIFGERFPSGTNRWEYVKNEWRSSTLAQNSWSSLIYSYVIFNILITITDALMQFIIDRQVNFMPYELFALLFIYAVIFISRMPQNNKRGETI